MSSSLLPKSQLDELMEQVDAEVSALRLLPPSSSSSSHHYEEQPNYEYYSSPMTTTMTMNSELVVPGPPSTKPPPHARRTAAANNNNNSTIAEIKQPEVAEYDHNRRDSYFEQALNYVQTKTSEEGALQSSSTPPPPLPPPSNNNNSTKGNHVVVPQIHLTSERARLQSQINRSRDKNTKLRQELESLQEKHDSQQRLQLAEWKSKLLAKDSEILRLKKKVQGNKKQYVAKLGESNTIIKELRSAVQAKALAESEELNSEIIRLKEHYGSKLGEKDDTIKELRDSLDAATCAVQLKETVHNEIQNALEDRIEVLSEALGSYGLPLPQDDATEECLEEKEISENPEENLIESSAPVMLDKSTETEVVAAPNSSVPPPAGPIPPGTRRSALPQHVAMVDGKVVVVKKSSVVEPLQQYIKKRNTSSLLQQ